MVKSAEIYGNFRIKMFRHILSAVEFLRVVFVEKLRRQRESGVVGHVKRVCIKVRGFYVDIKKF